MANCELFSLVFSLWANKKKTFGQGMWNWYSDHSQTHLLKFYKIFTIANNNKKCLNVEFDHTIICEGTRHANSWANLHFSVR